MFHGPTLAFKDFAARFMSRLMSYLVRNSNKKLTILVATSGDTGSAVAQGFYKMPGIEVVIFYPSKKISFLQEKQIATLDENITAVEIKGTFDDCQKLVKQAFVDKDIKNKLLLSSANSINIARLIPQSFYYFYALSRLERKKQPVVFSVPSGNFGNLTGGLFAKKMGLPVSKFIAATNVNDVIPNYLHSGVFKSQPSQKTISNAMDVGNPSNWARIVNLYEHNLEKIKRILKRENEDDFYIPYFSGSLNGNLNVIRNLNISTNALFRYGLFSNLYNASIENLILENVNISCSDEVYLGGGGLAGSSYNSIISNVQVDGSIGNEDFSINDFSLVGGLVGFCGDTTISDCFVSGFCYGPVLGGLVGYSSNSTVTNCNVNNSKDGNSVGGLVCINNNSIISNCYAEGTIEMVYNSGGLIAIPEDNSTIINSYYNYDSVLINGENLLTIGALYETEYDNWINNNLYLNIDEYLTSNGEYYLINNIDDFKLLLAFGLSSEYNFLLMNDIDLNSNNNFYIPYFAGHFNGNDYSIYNINLNQNFVNNYGLFGYTNNVTIENIKLLNVDLDLMGGFNIGSLVGYCDNYSKINNCFVNGSISGSSIIGGLVGISNNNSEVNNCFSDCLITGASNIGGLVGPSV